MAASYERGFTYVGASLGERLAQWQRWYQKVVELPNSTRVLPFSYDGMCKEPAKHVANLTQLLWHHRIEGLDQREFARPHFANEGGRLVASIVDGRLAWREMPSYREGHCGLTRSDLDTLNTDQLQNLEAQLRERFGPHYLSPHEYSLA
jgi:hypothetical protein